MKKSNDILIMSTLENKIQLKILHNFHHAIRIEAFTK